MQVALSARSTKLCRPHVYVRTSRERICILSTAGVGDWRFVTGSVPPSACIEMLAAIGHPKVAKPLYRVAVNGMLGLSQQNVLVVGFRRVYESVLVLVFIAACERDRFNRRALS